MNGEEGPGAVLQPTGFDKSRMTFETIYTDAPAVSPEHENSNQSGTTLKEHDYIGLSDVSSSSSTEAKHPENARREELNLNLSATELRLGPPAAVKSPKSVKGNDQESTTLTGPNSRGSECYMGLEHALELERTHAANTVEGSTPQDMSAIENAPKRVSYNKHQELTNKNDKAMSDAREPIAPSSTGTTSLAHRALGPTEPEQRPEFTQSLLGGLQRNNILQEFRMAQLQKAAQDAQHAQRMNSTPDDNLRVLSRPRQHGSHDNYAAGLHTSYTGPQNMFVGVKNNGVKRGFEAVGEPHGCPSGAARDGQCEGNGDGAANEVPDAKVKTQPGKSWIGATTPTLNTFNHKPPSWPSNASLGPFAIQSMNMRRSLMSKRVSEVQDASDSSNKGGSEANKQVMNESRSSAVQEPVSAPASTQQTVGWPPVRSFVRSQNPVKQPPPQPAPVTPPASVQGKGSTPSTSSNSWFVKIYMDGVPFGRKVDLKSNNSYEKLYPALEEMFQQFINGQYCGSRSSSIGESHAVTPSRKLNFLDGSEYVLIYEDREGDFMLVGDVPWEMFIRTVKRLRIMKGSEEVNLAPRNGDSMQAQAVVG